MNESEEEAPRRGKKGQKVESSIPKGKRRQDVSKGASTGAISVSSYASTHDAPVSTLSAGPGSIAPSSHEFGATRPACT